MSHLAGIKGLDIILNHSNFPPNEAEKGFRLLIRGVPGTGKTTLGLHIVNNQLKSRKGLIIYLQEDIQSMDRLSAQFQLNFRDNPPETAKVSSDEYRKKFPFIKNWINKKIKNNSTEKLCIFIDGLSLAKSTFDSSLQMHDFISRLLIDLPRDNVFLIVAAEDDLLSHDNFFQHLVDCVIDLTISDNIQRHRFLEIKKCRYIDYFRGKHGFEMFRDSEKKSNLQVYPSPSCHFLLAKNTRELKKKHSENPTITPISSGIINLEKIIRGDSDDHFLNLGDSFAITAEPGTDKIGFGLSFLSDSLNDDTINQKSLWLSFGCNSLDRILSFKTYKERFPCLDDNYRKYNPSNTNAKFVEIDRLSIVMHPDRVLFQLMEYLSNNKTNVVRVIVDGLNNIGREFDDSKKIIEYTFMIIRILRYFSVVGIIFLDLPKSFQNIKDISMEWAEEADFIGHLGKKEIKNNSTQTFFVTKSRYSTFSTTCYQVDKDINNGHVKLLDMSLNKSLSSTRRITA